MRVLLTGAGGFTGRHLRAELERAGHEVAAVSARLDDAAALRAEIAAARLDALVHLAAVAFVAHDDPRAFYDVNLTGTVNLLEALDAAPTRPRRVILSSSANIYGPGQSRPLGEDAQPSPVNHYAVSKLAMEHAARLYVDRLPLVIVRPFNYTGPGQAAHFVVPKIVRAFAQAAPSLRLGRTDVRRDFSDVRAICAAYRGLLEAEALEHDTYNLCSAGARSVDEVLAICARLSGHELTIERDPALMRRGEIDLLVGDNARLRAALPDWRPIPIERTLEAMLAHERTRGEASNEATNEAKPYP